MTVSDKSAKDIEEGFGGVLAQAPRLWRRAVDQYLQPFGLTEATWIPLIHLVRATTQLRQKDLAFVMSLDGSSLVRLLDNLEASGLIRRKEETSDRRAKLIVLTERGQTVAWQVETIVRQIQAEMFEGLSGQEMALTYKVLQHISGKLKLLTGIDD